MNPNIIFEKMVQSFLIKKKIIYLALIAFIPSILLSILITYYISLNSITQHQNCSDANSPFYLNTFSKTNKTNCNELFCKVSKLSNIDYNSICHEKYSETTIRGIS